jgi:hypothetical protein
MKDRGCHMPPRLGWALNATPRDPEQPDESQSRLHAGKREHLPCCDATPHRQEGQVRPADEAGQCPGGSLFEIQGKAGEVTPTSCAGPADRGSRSGIPVPTDSPAHRMFRLYATRSGPLMIIEACITSYYYGGSLRGSYRGAGHATSRFRSANSPRGSESRPRPANVGDDNCGRRG